MTPNTFDKDRFLSLLAMVLEDEELNPNDREALNDTLRNHPEARRLYRDQMELHSRLHLDYRGGLAPEAMPGEPASNSQPAGKPSWVRPALALAATLIATLFITNYFRSAPQAEVDIPVKNGVAVFSRSLDVEWGADSPTHQEGDTLAPGPILLTSGLAQIEFIHGASVILEGPAELEIISSGKAVLRTGRLRAFVPEPARGFIIEGPSYDAVDLGTEFAMSIDATGQSEVHVIDGEVALHEKGGPEVVSLTTGRAARLASDGPDFEEIALDDTDFIDRQTMLRMSDQSWEVDFADWKTDRKQLANCPDTIVYFDFEDHQPWDRQIHNAAATGPNGGIVGARWTTGRWPGKGALEFKRVTDRIRLNIEDAYESLTLATWVRIGGLDQRHNSLFLTDGWERGEPHWHIGNRGELTFGISTLATLQSEPLLGPADLGRWLHLAVTYDATSGEITQYLDGRPIASLTTSKDVPILFGSSEIGNWQPKPGSNAAVRSFNGRFDEFLISKRAYSGSEIQNLFESGTPYR